MFRVAFKRLGLRKKESRASYVYRPGIDTLEQRRVLATIHVDDDGDEDFTSIQAAVAAANPGDTIKVSPGVYNESVVVDKRLTILGAQKEFNPTRREPSASKQSIVEVPAGASHGFQLAADDIVLRGFTIQDSNDDGNPAGVTGIDVEQTTAGHTIANNIIQSNTTGIYLNTDGTDDTLVRRNLIRDNNQAGAAAGNGIYSDQGLASVDIVENRFNNQDNAAIIIVGGPPATAPVLQTDISIERNVMTNGGNAGVIMINTTNSEISRNVMTNHGGSAIFLGGGVSNVDIERNVLTNGAFTGINVTASFTGVADTDINITQNVITNFGDAGIQLREGANNILVSRNTVTRSGHGIWVKDAVDNLIERNQLDRNLIDGIRAEATSANNVFSRNNARRNVEHDYHDESNGGGTAGTANTWTRNKGRTQNRPGLINNS